MSDSLRQVMIRLRKDDVRRLPGRRGDGVAVFEGRVWITEDGSPLDTVLEAGQSQTFESAGDLLVQGLTDAVLIPIRGEAAAAALLQPVGDAERPVRAASATANRVASGRAPEADPSAPLWFFGERFRPLVLRSITPNDAGALAEFIKALSPLSRLRRFHTPLKEASPQLLKILTEVDPATAHALMVLALDGDVPRVVAEARYVADPLGDATQREFALAVADELQHQGLGARLLRALIARASRNGVKHLFGDVLRDNLPMLRLVEREGFVVRRHPEDARLLRVGLTLEASGARAPADLQLSHLPRAQGLALAPAGSH